jgi:hypothetical protein
MTENIYRVSCELSVTVDDAQFQRNTKPEEYFKYLKDFEVTKVIRVERL